MLQDIGELILSCTKNKPGQRPTASSLAQIDVFSNSKVMEMQESIIRNLEDELRQKEIEVLRT